MTRRSLNNPPPGVNRPPPPLQRGGACRAAPDAANVERRMRLALDKAQQKLLASRRKLQTSVAAMRALLSPDD